MVNSTANFGVVLKPKWSRFHSKYRKRGSNLASGPMAHTPVSNKNASEQKARMRKKRRFNRPYRWRQKRCKLEIEKDASKESRDVDQNACAKQTGSPIAITVQIKAWPFRCVR